MNIEKTAWAKRFKKEDSMSYERAIELVSVPDLVVDIYQTDETGEKVWAIVPEDDPEFWLDAFKRKQNAVSLCKKMNWRIMGLEEQT